MDCEDIEIRKSQFVTKTQFLSSFSVKEEKIGEEESLKIPWKEINPNSGVQVEKGFLIFQYIYLILGTVQDPGSRSRQIHLKNWITKPI